MGNYKQTLNKKTHEDFYIEVRDYHDGLLATPNQCVGSVRYPFHLLEPDSSTFSARLGVGCSNCLDLTGPCSRHAGGANVKGGRVLVKGKVTFPFQCASDTSVVSPQMVPLLAAVAAALWTSAQQ